jgi:hypothetical protein
LYRFKKRPGGKSAFQESDKGKKKQIDRSIDRSIEFVARTSVRCQHGNDFLYNGSFAIARRFAVLLLVLIDQAEHFAIALKRSGGKTRDEKQKKYEQARGEKTRMDFMTGRDCNDHHDHDTCRMILKWLSTSEPLKEKDNQDL